MHEDQLRSLLRSLEGDREPVATFADTLYDRLNLGAGVQARRRAPWVLLAAALLAVLTAGLAVGSGFVRLPATVDASASANVSQSTSAVASPSASADPSPSEDASPSASADPTASVDANPSASAEPSAAPDPVGLAGAILFAEADGLRLRSQPAEESDVLATLRRGQLMGATGERQTAAGTDWYEVRIGPGELAGWVAAGPDGDWLRLVEDGAVVFQCYGCTDEGASVVSVTPLGDAAIGAIGGEDLTEWRWSPDGSRLVASRGGTTLPYRIVTLAPDGTQLEEVGIGVAAAWSPDGSRLAWLGEGLVVTDDNLEPSLLDVGGAYGAPLWSPDGSRLALVGAEDPSIIDPPVRLLVVPIDGGPAQQLIEPGTIGAFSWAPDGSRLAFVEIDLSGQQPNRAFVVPADGGSRAPLLEDVAVNAPPTWSPDGTRVATSSADGLVTANGDGTDARILVQIGAAETIGEVRWSPSGEWLLYTKSSGRNPTMWIVPSDGSDEPRSISPSGTGAQQGEWQPVLVDLP